MTLRSAIWTGTSGSAWPALDNADTWASGFWASPAVDAAQIAAGPTIAVDGSNHGYITATHNLAPLIAATGTPQYTTAASTAGRYTFAGSFQPTTTNSVNLVFVTTTWTASHYHQIVSASCTGGWTGLTFDKITDYVYNIGAVYYCLSIFRTVNSGTTTAGSIVVDVYDTSTGLIVGTQATGGTCQALSVWGVDTSSNGANMVRAANTTTATNTTGQPAVTLPNNLSKYSSLPIMFCSHGTANTSTSSSDSTLIASGSYATPSNGVASFYRPTPTSVASIKTTKTMTASFATATTGWGAIGLEILDASSSDSYTDRTRDYTYVRIANSTNQPAYQTSEVRALWTSTEGSYGPYHGLIGRYVTSGGTKYWLGASLRLDSIKSYGNAYIYAATDNGTTTTVVNVAGTSGSTNGFGSINMSAMRVRVLASGDLWVSAKWWINGASEPAWPTASTDASVYDNTVSAYAVVNGVYSTSDALRNATSGQTGLYYLYPAATSTGLSSGVWYSPTDGVNTATWSTWTNDAWVVSGTSSLTGTGSMSSTALRIAIGSASISGGGVLAGTGLATAIGSAALSGAGGLSADGVRVAVGLSALVGSGAISATAIATRYASGTMSADGALAGVGARFLTALGTMTGAGYLTGDGSKYVVGGRVSSAIEAISRISSVIADGPGVVSNATNLADGVVSSTHALRP